MLYWSLFLLSIFIIIVLESRKYDTNTSSCFLKYVYAVALIYFSSFRCGLGTDYMGYIDKMGWVAYFSELSIINEPIFTILARVVNDTIFSPVLLFSVFSIVTILGIFSFYNNSDNKFWVPTVVVFSLLPMLYFNTFNLVRQFAATAIFFFSLRYIRSNNFYLYLICIILAALIHLSAIMLLPCYFFLNRKIKPRNLLLFLIISFVIASQFFTVIERISFMADRYTTYLETEERMGTSFVIILYNILGAILIKNNNKINTQFDRIAVNCFFLLILFSDLSFVNFYFFRIAIYFSPVFAYILPKVLSFYFDRKISAFISILFALVLFMNFIYSNLNNPVVVPDAILPLSSLFRDDIFNRIIF